MAIEIEVKNLVKTFPKPKGEGTLYVFDRISLEVEKGSFTVILGPSGCGKSTLLNIINGILEPTHADKLAVGDGDIRENPDLRRRMGYIFQHPRLLNWRTLRANVLFALKALRLQPEEKWEELARKYLEMVGLGDYMDYYPRQISGGMQQRASIARAWANEPRVLLMDEPFSHLDEITARGMRTELIKLWTEEEEKKTILFVTHDMSEGILLADYLMMLSRSPSMIFHKQRIDIPRPRDPEDERLFEIERDSKRRFYKELTEGRHTH